MDSDGENAKRLTKPGSTETDAIGNRSPDWSPDGTLIAYVGTGTFDEEEPRDQEIYVMRADGSEPRRLTNTRVPDSTPTWSPDGERIAFSTSGAWAGAA